MPGGVCAVLDYDVEMMAEYVAAMAVRVVTPGASVTPPFRKFVSQVLTSTRLPSTTILLGMNYLAKRINGLKSLGPFNASEGQVWRFLLVGLLLGSKFLDDNTFQNKSWSDVSGIHVKELNDMERDWILAMEWRLYVNLDEQKDYQAWLSSWKTWEGLKKEQLTAAAAAAAAQVAAVQATREKLPLQRLDTDMSRMSAFSRPTFTAYSLQSMDAMDYQPSPLGVKRRSAQDNSQYRSHDSWYGNHWQPTPATPADSGYGTPECNETVAAANGRPNDWFTAFSGPAYRPQQPQQQQSQPMSCNMYGARIPQVPFQPQYPHGLSSVHHTLGDCFCTACVVRQQPGPYFGATQGFGAVMG